MKKGGMGQMLVLGFLGVFIGLLISKLTGINQIMCVIVGLTGAIMMDTYLTFFRK